MFMKQFIIEVLAEKATKDDVFGEFLFGDERSLGEPNTCGENTMAHRFDEFYGGDVESLTRADIAKLVSLRDDDKYIDVLSVPDYAHRAWRVIEVNENILRKLVGKLELKEGELLQPTLFTGSFNMPIYKNRPTVSWTISSDAVPRLLTESLGYDFVVLLSANLNTQRDSFLLNPQELTKLSREFFWQAEIWQAKTVTVDKIAVCSSYAINMDWKTTGSRMLNLTK